MKTKTCVVLFLAISLAGCATVDRTWRSVFGGSNPLVGKIWDVKAKRFITQSALIGALEDTDYVILGEKHDNPDHHLLQAEVISDIGKRGKKVKVGFEQFSKDQQEALKTYLDLHPGDAGGIGEAIGWKKLGWPDYKIYEPVFAAALANKYEIFPLGMSEVVKKRVGEKGLEGLDDNLFRELNMDRSLPAGVQALLSEEIRSSHCYKVPDAVLPRMIEMQKARDAVMAYQADAESKRMGAVLIVGNGHARNEWGVPLYLRRINRIAKRATVSFTEVRDEYEKPEIYVEGDNPYDYIWFTPALSRDNPCETHAEELEKLEKAKASLDGSAEKKVEEPAPAPKAKVAKPAVKAKKKATPTKKAVKKVSKQPTKKAAS